MLSESGCQHMNPEDAERQKKLIKLSSELGYAVHNAVAAFIIKAATELSEGNPNLLISGILSPLAFEAAHAYSQIDKAAMQASGGQEGGQDAVFLAAFKDMLQKALLVVRDQLKPEDIARMKRAQEEQSAPKPDATKPWGSLGNQSN